MKTNSELLIDALGWQDGSIHDVARETGLSSLEIVHLASYYPCDGDVRAQAYHFCGKIRASRKVSPLILNTDFSKIVSGDNFTGYDNLMYWRGVLDAMKEKELE